MKTNKFQNLVPITKGEQIWFYFLITFSIFYILWTTFFREGIEYFFPTIFASTVMIFSLYCLPVLIKRNNKKTSTDASDVPDYIRTIKDIENQIKKTDS